MLDMDTNGAVLGADVEIPEAPGSDSVSGDALAREARETRSADAMYRLGMMFSTGQGVTYDIVEAHKWFNLAATMGSEDAKRWRKELAAEMSSTQVAEAQRQAREWLRAA
ncbi:MAG: hypothetical protein ACFB6R_02595 [Alphaproteobacteria bacterium]